MSERSSWGSEPEPASASTPDFPLSLRTGSDEVGAPAFVLTSSDSIVVTRKSPEQLEHEHAIERSKEEHRQRVELEAIARKREEEAHRRSVERSNWFATVILLGAIVLISAATLLFAREPRLKELAFGGLMTIFGAWMGYLAGQAGKTKKSNGE